MHASAPRQSAGEFRPGKPVGKELKRLACRRANQALCDLKVRAQTQAVYQLRRHLKKLRALLQLGRGALDPSTYNRAINTIRKTSRNLSGTRDAVVRPLAFKHLARCCPSRLSAASTPEIRKLLAEDCRQNRENRSPQAIFREVGRLLQRICSQLVAIKFHGSGWAIVAPGLKSHYRKGRQAYRRARRDSSAHCLHDWRKHVKNLYYQLRVFRPVCPIEIDSTRKQLKALGRILGDHHDLFLLTDPGLTRRLTRKAPREVEVLSIAITRRQEQLRAKALGIGPNLYREKPGEFCQRLHRHWKQWRGKKRPHAD